MTRACGAHASRREVLRDLETVREVASRVLEVLKDYPNCLPSADRAALQEAPGQISPGVAVRGRQQPRVEPSS